MVYLIYIAGMFSGVAVLGLWVVLVDEWRAAKRARSGRNQWLDQQFAEHRKTLENTNVRWLPGRRK